MKRILGLGLFMALFSISVFAAKNSYVFLLYADAQVGGVQLPQGECEATWTEPSGSQVQLTIRSLDKKKSVTVPAQVVEAKQSEAGMGISVVNGVRYLQEVHTTKVKFIIQDAAKGGR